MNRSSLSRRSFFKLGGGIAGLGLLSYILGLRNQRHDVPPDGLPAYNEGASPFPVLRGPYLQRDAQLAAWLFPADLAALTRLCDQTLNRVPDSPFTYTPLTS